MDNKPRTNPFDRDIQYRPSTKLTIRKRLLGKIIKCTYGRYVGRS
jgi:hypothetical protein